MKKTIAVFAAFAAITISLLVGCKSGPERTLHTAVGIQLNAVEKATDVWLDTFILRAEPYRATNAAGRIYLDLEKSPALSHEWRVVENAFTKWQQATRAQINLTIAAKTLASTNGITAEQLRLFDASLAASAAELLLLLNINPQR